MSAEVYRYCIGGCHSRLVIVDGLWTCRAPGCWGNLVVTLGIGEPLPDYYVHRAFLGGRSGRVVVLKRGPFLHRRVVTFTRWGAKRLARKWEESRDS